MRDWRKVYKVLTTSERVGLVSFEARWLYVCLLLHQDDAGRFPWNKPMVRNLTATTDWTHQAASKHLAELERAGLVSQEQGWVSLRKGQDFNGVPRDAHSRTPRLYPEAHDGAETAESAAGSAADAAHPAAGSAAAPRLEERRGEEIRGDEKRGESTPADAGATRSPSVGRDKSTITGEFVEEMVTRYGAQLGGEEPVREAIKDAMAHKNVDKWKDKERYVNNWLKREAGRSWPNAKPGKDTAGHNGAGGRNGRTQGHGPHTPDERLAAY